MLTRLSRVVCPAWIDTYSFSCVTPLRVNVQNLSSTTISLEKQNPNKTFTVSSTFYNRNPRNLESMALARKRKGWDLQFPRRDFYNKLVFDKSGRNTSGWVEHSSGRVVVSASTKEWAIKQHLYSCVDVSAAQNVGRVLAQRCLESGLTQVFFDEVENPDPSDAVQAFLKSMVEGPVELVEPDQLEPEYKPGIDYDRPNRYGEKKKMKTDYQPS